MSSCVVSSCNSQSPSCTWSWIDISIIVFLMIFILLIEIEGLIITLLWTFLEGRRKSLDHFLRFVLLLGWFALMLWKEFNNFICCGQINSQAIVFIFQLKICSLFNQKFTNAKLICQSCMMQCRVLSNILSIYVNKSGLTREILVFAQKLNDFESIIFIH